MTWRNKTFRVLVWYILPVIAERQHMQSVAYINEKKIKNLTSGLKEKKRSEKQNKTKIKTILNNNNNNNNNFIYHLKFFLFFFLFFLG